jgi:hypothetical protein
LVAGTDRLAEASHLLEARLAQASVGVAVVVISRRTVSANSSDSHILGLAEALLGDVAEVFVDSLARNNAAGLGVDIIALASKALRAGTLDNVEALGAIALSTVEVIDLVGSALSSADTLVDVIDLAGRALGAEVVDEVVSRLADTSA